MHVPDLLLEPWLLITFVIISFSTIGISIYKLRKDEETYDLEKTIPFIGLMAAFIFGAQMLNFPVTLGVSGHLVGGVLIAVLLGPYAGVIVMTLVILVQMMIGDGGITAIGVNLFNMGIIGCFLGILLVMSLVKLLKGRISDDKNLIISAGIASFCVTVFAATWLGIEIVLSANVNGLNPTLGGIVISLMAIYHCFIGIGEALITCAVLGFIIRVKPDLILMIDKLNLDMEVPKNGVQ